MSYYCTLSEFIVMKNCMLIFFLKISNDFWEQRWELLWFDGKWVGIIWKYLCKCIPIAEAVVHRLENKFLADFR